MDVVYFPLGASKTEHTGESINVYQCTYNERVGLIKYNITEDVFIESDIKFLIFRGYSTPNFDAEIEHKKKLIIPIVPGRRFNEQLVEACAKVYAERPPSQLAIFTMPLTGGAAAPVPISKQKKRVIPTMMSAEQAEQQRIAARYPSFKEDIPVTDLMFSYITACITKSQQQDDSAIKNMLASRIAATSMNYTVLPQDESLARRFEKAEKPEERRELLVRLMADHRLEKIAKKTGQKRKPLTAPTGPVPEEEQDEDEPAAETICDDIERFLEEAFSLEISPRVKKDTVKIVPGDGLRASAIIAENTFLGILPVFPHTVPPPEPVMGMPGLYLTIEGRTFGNPDPQARIFSFFNKAKTSPLLRLKLVKNRHEANVQAVVTAQQQVAIITLRAISKDEVLTLAETRGAVNEVGGNTTYFDRVTGKLLIRSDGPPGLWTSITVDTWTDGIPSYLGDNSNVEELKIPERVPFPIDPDILALPRNDKNKVDIRAVIKTFQNGARWAEFKRIYEPHTVADELRRMVSDKYCIAEMSKAVAKYQEYPLLENCQPEFNALIANESQRIRLPGEFPFFHDEKLYNRMVFLRERCIAQKNYNLEISELIRAAEDGHPLGVRYIEYIKYMIKLGEHNLVVPQSTDITEILKRRQHELAADKVSAEVRIQIATVDVTTKLNTLFEVAEKTFRKHYETPDDEKLPDDPKTVEDMRRAQINEKTDYLNTTIMPRLEKLGIGTNAAMSQRFSFYKDFVDTLVEMTSGELKTYHTRNTSLQAYRNFYASELLSLADLGRWTSTDVFETEEDDLSFYITTILASNMASWNKEKAKIDDKEGFEGDDVYVFPSVLQQVRNLVAYRRDCINWYRLVLENQGNLTQAAADLGGLLNPQRLKTLGVTAPLDIEAEIATLDEAQLKRVNTAINNNNNNNNTFAAAAPKVPDPFEYVQGEDKTVAAVKALARFLRQHKVKEFKDRSGTKAAKKEEADLKAYQNLDEEAKYRAVREARGTRRLTVDMILGLLSESDREEFAAYEDLWELYHEKAETEKFKPAPAAAAPTGPAAKKGRVIKDEDDDTYEESMSEIDAEIAQFREVDGLYLEEGEFDDVRFVDPPAALAKSNPDEYQRRLDELGNERKLQIALHYYAFTVRKAIKEVDISTLVTAAEMWSLIGGLDEDEKKKLPNYPSEQLYATEHDEFFMMQVLCQRDITTDTYSPIIQEEKLGLQVKSTRNGRRGVFTTIKLPFGLCLGIFGGDVITEKEYQMRYPPGKRGEYVFKLDNSKNYSKETKYIDGKPNQGTSNIMSYVEDYRDVDPSGPNVEFVELVDLPVIKIITLRDIEPGEQLLADHGGGTLFDDDDNDDVVMITNDNNNNNNNKKRPNDNNNNNNNPEKKTAVKKEKLPRAPSSKMEPAYYDLD